jgi:hypothetical protein
MLQLLLAGTSLAGQLFGASANARAQKKALAAQTLATQQQQNQNQRQFDQTRADNMPFIQGGYRRMAAQDELLGIQGGGNAFSAGSGAYPNSDQGGSPYSGYVQRNPDLLAAFNASGGRYGSMEDFGQTHYNTHGQSEDRDLYMPQATNPEPASSGQIERDPMLLDRTNTAFAAKGMGGDSATSNAMARALMQDKYSRVMDYNNSLQGGINQGQQSVQSVGQLGANYAQNQNGLTQNQANATGSSYAAKAANQNQVISAVGNAFSQIAGGWGKPKKSSYGGW